MGNNNVTGQQVSEETTNGVHNSSEPSNGSPGLNSRSSETYNEKDGTEDVNLSKSSKDPIITNAEDKQVNSNKNISSDKIEGLDEKNRSSIQDNTSTQEDDQSSNLPKDDEQLRKEAIETTVFSTEVIALVSTSIEDVSNKDSLISSEKIKQLRHRTRDTSEEKIEGSHKSLLQGNIEGSIEDQEEDSSHQNAPMGDNLAGEDTIGKLEQGYIEVPTVEDKMVAMQGETTSSIESIVSSYLDADDSEIKEVVIEDKPGQRDSPPDVQLLGGINMETYKDENIQTQIPLGKEEISAIRQSATLKLMVESDKALEDDKHIHGLGNQDGDSTECTPYNLYNDKAVAKCQSSLRNPTAINDQEMGNEQNERVTASRQISGSVAANVEHVGIETIYKEERIVEKTVAVWNLEDNFAAEKEPEEYDSGLVSIAEINGNHFTGLNSPSVDSHLILIEVKVQREVNGVSGIGKFDKESIKEILEEDDKVNTAEELGLHIDVHVAAKEGGDSPALPVTTPSTPLQLLEDIDEEVHINRDTQETTISSQGDQSQQILLEEYGAVKVENAEILSNCMQLVGDSSNVGISTDGINYEKVGMDTRTSDFTFETNHKEVTASTAATCFTAECNQAKVTASVHTATEEQHPFQTSTPGREAGEDTPLLQAVQNIGFFSPTKQHSQVDVEIPTTDIAVVQFKAEAEEESEKSPLLSPKEPSGGEFRIPIHSARNKKPFQSLLTEVEVGVWSPLKEQESNPKSKNIMVSSPRSKEKQKPRSSFLTSCMCCTTATN